MDSASTIEIKVHLDESLHELLIAELSDLDFQTFVEEDQYVLAYIRAGDWNDVARESIERWLTSRGISPVIEEVVHAPEDWNRRWEETARAFVVGKFVVKPTWADVPPEADDLIVLEVDPKMSFGTGYHESTRLALRLLAEYVCEGAHVLDAGTGTGVLAIAAAKTGAASVFAFDVDPWSYTNALENLYINGVADVVTVASGSLEVVPDRAYDLIMANIDRSELIHMLPEFRERLAPQGSAILSGLLHADRELMLRHASHWGFRSVDEATEGSWWAVVLQRGAS